MFASFPRLIAAAHVLHRLLAPRHPPCALRLLIVKNTVSAAMEFSRCARAAPALKTTPNGGLSKLNSVSYVEVNVILGELGFRTLLSENPDSSSRAERLPKQELRIP